MSDEPAMGEIWGVYEDAPFMVLSNGWYAFLDGRVIDASDMHPPTLKLAKSLEHYFRAKIVEEILPKSERDEERNEE